MDPERQYRCRFCGALLPAWLPAAQAPNGALLLDHLSQHHPGQVTAYLDRMHRDTDITPVVVEAFELVEKDESR